MLTTAENVARKHGLSTAEQHEVVLHREARSTPRRRPTTRPSCAASRPLPFEVPAPGYRKTLTTLAGDEGVTSTVEGLAALKPVAPGGSVTLRRPDASGRRQRRARRDDARTRA